MVVSGRTWFTPGIPGIYVVLLCDVLRDLGHDPAALLKTLGLKREQLLDSEYRLPLEQADAAAQPVHARSRAAAAPHAVRSRSFWRWLSRRRRTATTTEPRAKLSRGMKKQDAWRKNCAVRTTARPAAPTVTASLWLWTTRARA